MNTSNPFAQHLKEVIQQLETAELLADKSASRRGRSDKTMQQIWDKLDAPAPAKNL